MSIMPARIAYRYVFDRLSPLISVKLFFGMPKSWNLHMWTRALGFPCFADRRLDNWGLILRLASSFGPRDWADKAFLSIFIVLVCR